MKPHQLKKLFERLSVTHVFHSEAVSMLEPHYKRRVVAKNNLARLVKVGKIDKFNPIDYGLRCPPVYDKLDLLEWIDGRK